MKKLGRNDACWCGSQKKYKHCHEAFDEKQGCPLCRLRQKLENQSLSYIMGAAMMEPDIRIVTNQLGFCREHFHKMLGMGNRLSLALMLDSHLQYAAGGRGKKARPPWQAEKI